MSHHLLPPNAAALESALATATDIHLPTSGLRGIGAVDADVGNLKIRCVCHTSASQICLAHGIGLQQLLAGAGQVDLAVFQHIGVVADAQRLAGVLLEGVDLLFGNSMGRDKILSLPATPVFQRCLCKL